MPLLDIGYREWEGQKTPRSTRSLALASTGIHLVWKGTWLKRVLMFMAIPALIAGIFVAIFEQTLDRDGPRALLSIVAKNPQARNTAERAGVNLKEAIANPEAYRHFTWSFILFNLSRYPQALGMIVVLGLVAPRLISYDLRSRGYLLYLSRPLSPAEYIFGKSLVLYFLIFVMSALPALLIYIAGLFLSTDSTAIAQTWDIPFRILLASLVLMVPTTAVALAFSSMTQESRYAGFAWFAMWIVGHVTYSALVAIPSFEAGQGGVVFEPGWRLLTSPYQVLGIAQAYIFGFTVDQSMIVPAFLILIAASIVSLAVLFRRVAAPMYL